jgi:protein TonB
MRPGGLQEHEHVARSNRPRSLASALVSTALVAASCALGAVGTLLFLTHGSVRAPIGVTRAMDAARDLLSSDVSARDARPPSPSPDRTGTDKYARRPGARLPVVPSSAPPVPVPAPEAESDRLGGVALESRALGPPPAYVLPVPRSWRPERGLQADAVTVSSEVPVGGRVVLPAKTKDVHPAYPNVARRARIGGTVVLEAVITAEGQVADVRVATSAPLLDDAAVTAVRRWRYEPARLNHIPVAVPVIINVAFSPY